MEALVQRLVANPHDEEALAYAHQAGAQDPKAYAFLLEKVGGQTTDPAYASHWLSEAANVWLTTLGDAHRAARVLMTAIDRDPTQQVAAERLAQLYREKGDVKALVALLDRRAKALTPLIAQQPELRSEVAAMYEELGRLWSEAPLAQPKKAVESFRKSIDLDAQSAYAIYSAREILKSQANWEEAYPLYEAEYAIEQDPARRLALLRDEANSRRQAGDLQGVTKVLARARQLDDQDAGLQQEFAASILDRMQGGEQVPKSERTVAAEMLVALAESYDGEHGLAYSGAALDIEPGHERALQLYTYYARSLQKEEELSGRYLGYVESNPAGAMAAEARQVLAISYEAAGQISNAIQMLEPLRAAGDPDAAAKLELLYTQTAVPGAVEQSAAKARPATDRGEASPQAPSYTPSEPAPKRTSALAPDKLQGILDAAQMLAGKGKKPEALVKYKEVLDTDPAHPEALAWVEDYLRTKRDYGQLRDVLLASVRVMGSLSDGMEGRKERLREVAGLCEGNLRDVDGAINAWKQLLAIDRADDSARQSLSRLLEKTQRWDDLANLYEQEATVASDIDIKISLEKKLATLNEGKRRDFGAAAEAWARIAHLAPEDERAIGTASKLFEKAGRIDMAAQVIAENAASIEDSAARGSLLQRLGELREQTGDVGGAGEAYAESAEAQRSARMWEDAERCFVGAEKWERAASAAEHRGQIAGDAKQQAGHFARAGEYLTRAGDETAALERLEQATNLDPTADDYAQSLTDRYTTGEKWEKLVEFLSRRGDRVADRSKRVGLRRQAATLYATRLNNKDLAREQWLKVLEDGDDREALEKLIDLAVEREDHTEAATLLRRLGGVAIDKADKARIALREAELLADGVGDVDTAIVRYESILSDLDATCRPALQAIADLQEARENPGAAADALERELKLIADPQERGQIAARLARLYELLNDPRSAIRALDIVRKADLEDFDALARLCQLCEKTEQWDRVAELLALQIEVEGDEVDASVMTKKLAGILADKLDRGDEALAALTELADHGDQSIRTTYVELGDRLGWKGIVAAKLVEWWFEAKHGTERTAALRGAFERFAAVGRDQDAARVAIEIVRAKGGDRDLAARLEVLAVKTSDHDALATAHDLLARELQGLDRATELVRQAVVCVKAGMPRGESIQHGESGLANVPPGEAESLLEKLAELTEKSHDIVDLYERQVSRCRAPADRLRALARAAQVAASKGQIDRARAFFELALTGAPTEDTLGLLELAAAAGDKHTGGEKLRRALCQSLSTGGGGARDGGRTRSTLLRRAATIAQRDLHDIEQAFTWLGDTLIAHVDQQALDVVEALSVELGAPRRSEEAITRALTEVFDGPLVRQLLARRAKIRREHIGDKSGAAADLKKLHDLSPTDQSVLEELSALLRELGDYRGMVQLYEDQILRGKDMNTRAELARKVARMWEEQLQDPRETADAWRRVLRMKAGDAEATQGLERAKSNMLKKADPDADPDAYAPPKPSQDSMRPSQAPNTTATPDSKTPTVPPPTALPETVPGDSPLAESLRTDPSLRDPNFAKTAEAATVGPETRPYPAGRTRDAADHVEDATDVFSMEMVAQLRSARRSDLPAPKSPARGKNVSDDDDTKNVPMSSLPHSSSVPPTQVAAASSPPKTATEPSARIPLAPESVELLEDLLTTPGSSSGSHEVSLVSTDERVGYEDFNEPTMARPYKPDATPEVDIAVDDDEILIADDLAEEVHEDKEEEKPVVRGKTMPPPLPRS